MPRLPEFIQSFFSKAGNGIGGFLRWIADKTAGLRGGIKKRLDDFFIIIPIDRRIALTVIIGIPVVLLLIIIGASLLSTDASAKNKVLSASSVMSRRVPAEDLFIPEEPDFVPGVLLEREKREQWSVDDAAHWWQDPLRDGEQEWRDQIEKTVDDIMEKVP